MELLLARLAALLPVDLLLATLVDAEISRRDSLSNFIHFVVHINGLEVVQPGAEVAEPPVVRDGFSLRGLFIVSDSVDVLELIDSIDLLEVHGHLVKVEVAVPRWI